VLEFDVVVVGFTWNLNQRNRSVVYQVEQKNSLIFFYTINAGIFRRFESSNEKKIDSLLLFSIF